jgi:DnaJ-like protein/exodeoxyribonuclease X-like protein
VPKRDPRDVLGIEPGATPTQIKAAWRRLARAHHPDLIGDDPAASRVATRKMAEINEAYAALTRGGVAGGIAGRRGGSSGPADRGGGGPDDGPSGRSASRRGGPPLPKATPPVTARLDTTDTIRPRNQPLRPHGGSERGSVLRGQPPLRASFETREPPRASTPTGPLARTRLRNFQPPVSPPLGDALDRELEFGKFHGHTLGQVAAFEPSYIDWLATTITRDRDLVAAARVIRDDLDRRGVARRPRPAPDPRRAGQNGLIG